MVSSSLRKQSTLGLSRDEFANHFGQLLKHFLHTGLLLDILYSHHPSSFKLSHGS